MKTRCRSCDAPIRWVTTAAGKKMPLDADPVEAGNVLVATVGGEEVVSVLTGDDLVQERALLTPLFVSHFATCPNAADHRRTSA